MKKGFHARCVLSHPRFGWKKHFWKLCKSKNY